MLLSDLVSTVYDYLEDEITFEQLEDWIALRFPLLFQKTDSSVADLAATIELGFVEVSEGIIDEEEFRTRVRDAVRQGITLTFLYSADESITISTSSNQVEYKGASIGSIEPIRADAWA